MIKASPQPTDLVSVEALSEPSTGSGEGMNLRQ